MIKEELEKRITTILEARMNELDPHLPTILVAHGSAQGAVFGNERTIMLGKDLILPGSLIKDPRLDYVALGHIHKHQDLNPGQHPPVVYSGSIERVDFGEAAYEKGFISANVDKGSTTYRFVKLNDRPFFNRAVKITDREGMIDKLLSALTPKNKISPTSCVNLLRYLQ